MIVNLNTLWFIRNTTLKNYQKIMQNNYNILKNNKKFIITITKINLYFNINIYNKYIFLINNLILIRRFINNWLIFYV